MTDTQELRPGTLVTPSIRLVRLLGQGGMGSVWIGEHLRLRTQVVVKFMAAEYALNQEAMQRFEREASLAAQAKSPHVVQVFDHGVSELGLPYIAMELLEGEDLGQRIARQGQIPPQQFADWLTQACKGLGRAHAKGIVHRDIKPENIFLCDNDGEVLVKVLDFGIAKSEAAAGFSGTRTGAFLGTAYYMSPEQTMGVKDLDHRSDLWALGVVAFYALTGTRPFDGEAIGPLVMAITSLPIPTISSRNPALAPLDDWMARALCRDRTQRFESAKQMAEAFAAAVHAPMQHAVSSVPQPPAAAPAPTFTHGAPARTGPTLSASTMAPSVRSGARDETDALPAAVPKRGAPWLAIGLGAVVLLGGGALAAMRVLGSGESAALTSASAAAAAVPEPKPAEPTPVIATAPPAAVAEPAPAAAAPSAAASLAPATPAALRAPGSQAPSKPTDKPADKPIEKPSAAAPAVPAPAAAAPAAPAPAAEPVKRAPAATASARSNPLRMQIE
jgi:serine/threonine-protein kinase